MDILIFIVVGLFVWVMGVLSGWQARERYAQRVLQKLMGEVKESEEESEELIQITIEKHNEVFYVYDRKTKTFMGQGKNRDEIEDVLHERFPGKRFGASEQNLIEVGFIS